MSDPHQCPRPEFDLAALLRLIRFKVSQRMPEDWSPVVSREDLGQEVLVRVLAKIGRHSPARSRLQTFLSRIVDSTLIDVWREVHAQKRCPSAVTSPQAVHSHGGPEYWADPKAIPAPSRDCQIDVRDEIRKFPPDLAVLAEDLQTLELTEIAAKHTVNRATIYRRLQRLRRHWKDSPLQIYLYRSTDDGNSRASDSIHFP